LGAGTITDIGDVAQADGRADRGLDHQIGKRVLIAADFRRAPQGNIESLLVAVDLAQLLARHERLRLPSHFARCQSQT
jgi:hypothetical protein